MELFRKAITVKLSNRDNYLVAEDDQEQVGQDRDGSSKNAIWTVEFDECDRYLRFKSCFGKYLTATDIPSLPGSTRKKVMQTIPKRKNNSILWEPIRDGFSVRFKTPSGHFLRPKGTLPPWRNLVTHDVPLRMGTQEKILWDIEMVETLPKSPTPSPSMYLRQPSVDFPIDRTTPTLAPMNFVTETS